MWHTPTSAWPSISSAINTPNSGTPRMKLLVPSMGSTIQRNADWRPSAPYSSPTTAWSGIPRGDRLPNQLLGAAIGARDGRGVGLELDGDAGLIVLERHTARVERDLKREGEVLVEVNAHRGGVKTAGASGMAAPSWRGSEAPKCTPSGRETVAWP